MAMLNPQDAATLRSRFETELKEPVQIWLFTQALNCPGCPTARQIARELDVLSDKIQVVEKNPVLDADDVRGLDPSMVPIFVIRRPGEDLGIRYYGLPTGYEFSALVEAIVSVSRREVLLDPQTVQKAQQLTAPFLIRVFVTPTCPYCPQMALLAMQLALLRPNVTAEVIEASEFPEIATRYQVRAVPRTVVNDSLILDGAIPPDVFLDQLLQHQAMETRSQPPSSGGIMIP